jgi:hypothetical protein
MLNADTGRALSRPAGGPMASHDMYEGQTWKSHPGIDEALVWVLARIPVRHLSAVTRLPPES